jgi:hypothetical protein
MLINYQLIVIYGIRQITMFPALGYVMKLCQLCHVPAILSKEEFKLKF